MYQEYIMFRYKNHDWCLGMQKQFSMILDNKSFTYVLIYVKKKFLIINNYIKINNNKLYKLY